MRLSDYLKDYRKKNNMSQSDLAEKLFVTKQAVSKWENDKGMPDIEILPSIATMLNVSVDTLLQKDNRSRKDIFISKYKVIINCVPIMFVVLAIVLACILPGVHGYHWLYNFECYRKLIYFIFGKGDLVTPCYDQSVIYDSLSSGGISYFAVASFVFVCIGVALLIWGIIRNRLLIKINGNVCIIVSSILMFFIKVEGNSLRFGEGRDGSILDYRDFFKDGDIGSGVIWWSILCFVGGVVGIGITIWMNRWSREEE